MAEQMCDLSEERLMVAHLIEPVDEGGQFEDWPLHVTILPWFNKSEPISNAEVKRASERMKACRIALGKKALGSIEQFGPGFNIPVRLIKDSTSLGVMHGMLLSLFHENLESMDYIGGAYNPHLTIRGNDDPGESSEIDINRFSLIKYGKPYKTVIKNYDLRENETTS